MKSLHYYWQFYLQILLLTNIPTSFHNVIPCSMLLLFAGSLGSCRPLRPDEGVPVGEGPPWGCVLTDRTTRTQWDKEKGDIETRETKTQRHKLASIRRQRSREDRISCWGSGSKDSSTECVYRQHAQYFCLWSTDQRPNITTTPT